MVGYCRIVSLDQGRASRLRRADQMSRGRAPWPSSRTESRQNRTKASVCRAQGARAGRGVSKMRVGCGQQSSELMPGQRRTRLRRQTAATAGTAAASSRSGKHQRGHKTEVTRLIPQSLGRVVVRPDVHLNDVAPLQLRPAGLPRLLQQAEPERPKPRQKRISLPRKKDASMTDAEAKIGPDRSQKG